MKNTENKVTRGTITNEELSAYADFKLKEYDNDTTVALATCAENLLMLYEAPDQLALVYPPAVLSLYVVLKACGENTYHTITCNHVHAHYSKEYLSGEHIKEEVHDIIYKIFETLRGEDSNVISFISELFTHICNYVYAVADKEYGTCYFPDVVRMCMKHEGFVYNPEPEVKYIVTSFRLRPWIILNNALLNIQYPDALFVNIYNINKDIGSKECILSYTNIRDLDNQLIPLKTAKDMGYSIDEEFDMMDIASEELEDDRTYDFIVIINRVKERILNEVGEPRK